MRRFDCHSERSEESLTNVRPTFVGDPSANRLRMTKEQAQDEGRENGFTLAEIMVVMAITAVVGTILVLIFTNTLRGSGKSQILAVIKQNGQSVLGNIDKTVRDADNIICPTGISPSCSILVVVKDGVYTRYRMVLPDSSDPVPLSCNENGCIAWDQPSKENDLDPNTGQLKSDSQFINDVCLPNSLMSQAAVLTDTNSQTGVSVEDGFFTRNKSAGYKDQLTIEFKLGPGAGVPQAIKEQIDPVKFQTTVQLR